MGEVRDIMEKNIIAIDESDSVINAAKIMSEKDISFLVVTNQDKPVGIITERDFINKIASQDKRPSDAKLSDIISYKFRWVVPTTEIEDAIQKMLNNNIRRLIVLDDEKLAGVITQTDLASYLRSKLLIDGTMQSIEPEES